MSLISSLLMITACSNNMEQNETIEIPPLSGDIDPVLLIGEWDCLLLYLGQVARKINGKVPFMEFRRNK